MGEREELLRDMEACRISGGATMSTAVLRHIVHNCHKHARDPERIRRQTDNVVKFFTHGEAERLASAPSAEFFLARNLVRLFPVPRAFGFLLSTAAEEHCGYHLTPAAAHQLQGDPEALEVYARGVQRVMDSFGVPPLSQNASHCINTLVKSFKALAISKQYSVCAMFYRLLASTYFLDSMAYSAIRKVFCKQTVYTLAHDFPEGTCNMHKAISYEDFQSELSALATYYQVPDSSPATSPQPRSPVGSRDGESVVGSRASSPADTDVSESEEAGDEDDGPHDVETQDIIAADSRAAPMDIPTLITPSHEHVSNIPL